MQKGIEQHIEILQNNLNNDNPTEKNKFRKAKFRLKMILWNCNLLKFNFFDIFFILIRYFIIEIHRIIHNLWIYLCIFFNISLNYIYFFILISHLNIYLKILLLCSNILLASLSKIVYVQPHLLSIFPFRNLQYYNLAQAYNMVQKYLLNHV